MTDRFGILSCRIPPIAVALSLAANLVWIPQALILADIVAAASIGTDAELTRLSPIMLASIFALLLVARSVAEVGAFAVSARTSVATIWKLDVECVVSRGKYRSLARVKKYIVYGLCGDGIPRELWAT